MFAFIKSLKGIIIISVVVVVAVSALFIGNGNNLPETVAVTKGTIREEVRLTGKLASTHDANLAFEISGKVRSVPRKVGDIVYIGDVLASLDTTDAEIQLRQAEAVVLADEATYEEIRKGTRPESIAISESKVASAKASYEDAIAQLADKIHEAYTKADDAIRNKVDQFFVNPSSTFPSLTFAVPNSQLEVEIKSGRSLTEEDLARLRLTFSKQWSDESILNDSENTKMSLLRLSTFLNNVALAVNDLSATAQLSSTVIDSYKAAVLSARTNVDGARASLLIAEEKVRSARSALMVAENDLALLKAGSTPEAISASLARLEQSKAAADKIRSDINKAYLRAPIKGVVTKLDIERGEVVSQNVNIASIIGDDGYKIEFYIPEVDIGRMAVGNSIRVILDAYPRETFSAKLTYIDPAETVVDGVVNFKGTAIFETDNIKLKSGLTANLYVEAFVKENVLIVPQYAILETDEGTFVGLDVGGNPSKTAVVVGIRSEDGFAEIISGINEGDKVYNIGLKDKDGKPILTL